MIKEGEREEESQLERQTDGYEYININEVLTDAPLLANTFS